MGWDSDEVTLGTEWINITLHLSLNRVTRRLLYGAEKGVTETLIIPPFECLRCTTAERTFFGLAFAKTGCRV